MLLRVGVGVQQWSATHVSMGNPHAVAFVEPLDDLDLTVPPRHDEYPRFLSAAWPYYAGAFSTSAAFILFVALWLAGDDREPKKNKGAKAE